MHWWSCVTTPLEGGPYVVLAFFMLFSHPFSGATVYLKLPSREGMPARNPCPSTELNELRYRSSFS